MTLTATIFLITAATVLALLMYGIAQPPGSAYRQHYTRAQRKAYKRAWKNGEEPPYVPPCEVERDW